MKMEKVVFIILLSIGGSMGMFHFCNPDKCKIHLPEDIPDDMLPSPEELGKICPPVLKTIRCLAEMVFACTGKPVVSWAASDNETIADMAQLFMSGGDLIMELCDEDSMLHEGYVNGVTCFKENIEEVGEACMLEGRKLYLEFRVPVPREEIDDYEAECMVAGYSVACVAMRMREPCGDHTTITFLEMVRRSKLLKYNACLPKDVTTLRSEFLDFLEEQGGNRDLFSVAFDFRKK